MPLSETTVWVGRGPRRSAPAPAPAECRDRRVRYERQTFARAVVDHRQDAKASAIAHLIVHKVERPALVQPGS